MPRYSLLVDVGENRSLHTTAANREEALAIFGKELGRRLTFEDQGVLALYLLDEWDEQPHWTNHTIPVFEASS